MHSTQQQQCFRQLQINLQQQSQLISAYIDYLAAIKQQVADNETETLNHLLSENQSHVDAIENNQRQQVQLLQQFAFEPTAQGLACCIEACDQQQQLAALRKTLQQQLEELEKSLLINDLLIRKNQQRVRQSIRILSGHSGTEVNTTYSRQGDTHNDDEKNSIALA